MATPQPEFEDQTPVAYLAGGGDATLVTEMLHDLARRRTHLFTVRLSAEEYVALQRVADAQHLPASTLARAWLLDRINANERAS